LKEEKEKKKKIIWLLRKHQGCYHIYPPNR
jgi:hypothetical protein